MRFFRDLLLAALVTGVVVLLAELSLVLAGVKYQGSFFTSEPERGYAFRPYARAWFEDEGDNLVTINSDGMDDKEWSIARPPGVVRIAVIGSSEVAAEQVQREQKFQAVMERRIASALNRSRNSIEVLNFGVGGYNLPQEYLTLQHQVWKYQPQIVILGTTSMALVRSDRKLATDVIPGTPFYDCVNGRLVADRPALPAKSASGLRIRNAVANIVNRSRILLALNEARINGAKLLAHYKQKLSKRPSSAPGQEALAMTDEVYNPDNPVFENAWRVEDCFFRAMKEECGRHGAEFWVVVFDREKSINPNAEERQAYARKVGVASLFLTDERMAKQAKDAGINTLMLGPDMLKYAEAKHKALHGFFNTPFNTGHWNAEGHKAAGQLISAALLLRSQVLRDLPRTTASLQDK